MEAERIRRILNIYEELKSRGEQFKNLEPCFVEGNDFIARLWTTANEAGGGSGTENIEDIVVDMPTGGKKEGGEDAKAGKGKGSGKAVSGGAEGKGEEGQSEGKGEGKSEGEGKGKDGKEGEGKGEGEGQGEGEKESEDGQPKHGGQEQKEGDGEEGEEKTDEQGMGQQPEPPIEEPEFQEPETPENPLEYKMKFPMITEMIYGVKICNTATEEQALSIEKRLFVGIGVVVCRNMMAESGTLGESVLTAKKKSYIDVFNILMILIGFKDKYDTEGNLIFEINGAEDEEELKSLILADKFMAKILPTLTVFNKDCFNKNQLNNIIDFCMARFDERNTVLVSENYSNENTQYDGESRWGVLIWSGEDRKNYKTNYYRYSSFVEKGKRATTKNLDNITATVVNNGVLEFSSDLDVMGEEFYSFARTVILNYLNSSSQELERHLAYYKNKKETIMKSATNILKFNIDEMLRN